MRRLILMRHAEAAADGGAGDHARGLTQAGRDQARQAGVALAEAAPPDFVLFSDSRRTRETFDRISDALGVAAPHRQAAELYCATPSQILAATEDAPPAISTLLIIGHNPGLGDLARSLCTTGGAVALAALAAHFPTSAFAIVSADAPSFARFERGSRLDRLFTVENGFIPPMV